MTQKESGGRMMKHTKEPWRVVSDVPVMAIYSEPEDYLVVQTVNQNNFNTYGKSRVDVGIYKQEDAERIVACVNACAGLTDEVLKTDIIKEALYFFWRVSDKVFLNEKNQMTYNGVVIFEEVDNGI